MATPEQLRAALESDDHQQLRRLCHKLERNLTVTAGGYEMSVAHHVATKWYALDSLKSLVKTLGADCLTGRNSNNNTPVHLAALFQDKAAMKFIHSVAGPGCFEEGGKHRRTAVHFAAMNARGNSALRWLARLLGQRCLRACDSTGNTPLHLSAWAQGAESMKFFKEELGPYCFQICGRGRRTPVHQAATNEASNQALEWLVRECGKDCLTVQDENGNTPVHLAAWKQSADSLQLVKKLLGTDVFALKGIHGCTVVHHAAMNTASNSALLWCVKELDSNCLLTKDSLGRTPVHLAALYQDEKSLEVAVTALEDSSCLLQPGQRQRAAAHYAAMNQQSCAALRWIVAHLGQDCLKQPDADGSMPLHLAAQYQTVDSLKFIKDTLGVPAFKLEGHMRRTMAHYAAQIVRKRDLVDWMVREIGPHCLLVPDAEGLSPAHLAGYYEESV